MSKVDLLVVYKKKISEKELELYYELIEDLGGEVYLLYNSKVYCVLDNPVSIEDFFELLKELNHSVDYFLYTSAGGTSFKKIFN